jgi:hypothetical protein
LAARRGHDLLGLDAERFRHPVEIPKGHIDLAVETAVHPVVRGAQAPGELVSEDFASCQLGS